MSRYHADNHDNRAGPADPRSAAGEPSEEDLWFLPGPVEDEPDLLLPVLRPVPPEDAVLAAWAKAEAGRAARLATVAGRLGALDERLGRGPEGWRHRLALIEAADLSWVMGDRIPQDRLALWSALRLSFARDDVRALARAGWAVRRLTGGPGPLSGLPDFLERRDRHTGNAGADSFCDQVEDWTALMDAGRALHPITRACMGFHAWGLAGLGQHGDLFDAAVTAARIAAGDGHGAVFAPLAMGGAGGLRVSGDPASRLGPWLEGMESAILAALRHLEQVEAWTERTGTAMAGLSGRTPHRLRTVMADWPLVSAPMAETLTGASRAAVQRNLSWMEKRGLIREITGHGRFRMWKAVV